MVLSYAQFHCSINGGLVGANAATKRASDLTL